jgi:hypothetical protein
MQITKQSNGIIELKTKNASAILDKSVRIGDVVLNGPGEYDVAGIAVVGFPGDEQPFYSIVIEEMSVVYFPEKPQRMSDKSKEELGSVDISVVPVNEGATVADTMALINSLEPNIVIPIGVSASVEEFAKQAGSAVENIDTLKITKSMLLPDERRIIVLQS